MQISREYDSQCFLQEKPVLNAVIQYQFEPQDGDEVCRKTRLLQSVVYVMKGSITFPSYNKFDSFCPTMGNFVIHRIIAYFIV